MSILVSADAILSTHDIEILPTQPEFRADPTSHITDTLNGSNRARARLQFFRLFEQKQEKSEQRATNVSNISLRFLKRSRTTKSTRCELNRINSSSVHIKTFAFSDEYTPLESWTTKTLYQSIWAFLGMDGVRARARF